ncbi:MULTISPECIES: SDR family oxidoreductase [Achromobacter]|nr:MULTISPECIES: SDR family NAD(P)-dependent oxidoreductase [Achromobacter]KNY06767.1 3-oxoacyl-ACP reductase [Achromobacter piechaudii]MPS81247.1 SDR family oxidoreductase [Achromobacter sp.]
MRSKRNVALVTGASGQIGQAICHRLGQDGFRVVLVDVSDAVHATAQRLAGMSIPARAVQLDITDRAAVDTLALQVGDWWQDLSVLVNNAGVSPKTNGRKRLVSEMPLEEWNRVLAVNLTGMFLVTQACLQTMVQGDWGRIVMIASQAARTRTVVPGAHYQATKAGTVGFARVLAAEVAPHGITVNCVAPGRVESDMTAMVDPGTNSALANAIPAGRMGTPQEVAGAVAYFVSEQAAYSTGAILDVNGGSFMP